MHAPFARSGSQLTLPLLVLVSMLGPLALNILMGSMPGLVQAFDTTRERVQLTLSLFLLAQAVSQLFLGPMSDRFGRRPVLIGSIACYVLASIGAAFAATIEGLILMRILQAFGATAGLTLGRTIIRDLYRREDAASMIGYVTMAMVVAPMLAPSIGAALDDYFGWRSIFYACAELGLLALVLTFLVLPETRPAALIGASAGDVLRRSAALVRDRRFLGYAGTSALGSAMFFAFLGGAPYLMIESLNLSKASYGIWFVTLSFGYMAGNFLSGRFSRRIGIDRLIRAGNIFGIAGSALMLVFMLADLLHPVTLFVPAMITSFSNGLTMPNAIAGSVSVDATAAGAASGLTGFLQMGLGAAASYAAGSATGLGAVPLALMMLCFASLAFAVAHWGRGRSAA